MATNSTNEGNECCKCCGRHFNYGDENSPSIKDGLWNQIVRFYNLEEYEKKAMEKQRNMKRGKDSPDAHLFICSKCMEKALGRKLCFDDMIQYGTPLNAQFESKLLLDLLQEDTRRDPNFSKHNIHPILEFPAKFHKWQNDGNDIRHRDIEEMSEPVLFLDGNFNLLSAFSFFGDSTLAYGYAYKPKGQPNKILWSDDIPQNAVYWIDHHQTFNQ